jgi:uncharacterized 2Fe-2S/4Fe-4S cluster protein (DUF4445 family)
MSKGVVRISIGGRKVDVEKGINLMEAMVSAGFMLRSDCGGNGRCGKCRVRVNAGENHSVSAPDEAEQRLSGEDGLAAGLRLSCRTLVFGEVDVEIPEESLFLPEVVQKGLPLLLARFETPPQAIRTTSAAGYGVAVDLGTTTIAVYLCDLENRTVAGSTPVRNPQAIFGDDVVSRIGAVKTIEAGLVRLQNMAVSAIDWAVLALCRRLHMDPARISSAVVVGNSTMIHLLLGEDPSCIGVFPYAPRFTESRDVTGGSIGLNFNPAVNLRTLPLISGFLGADLIGAALAADMSSRPPGTLLVDVGTNGEIILATGDGFAATSCATGPALEGASIRHGMQATSGAVASVRFDPRAGCLGFTLIQGDVDRPQPPAGICGSGVICAVAELLRAGVITKSGSYDPAFASPCLRRGQNSILEFEIVPGKAARRGVPIALAQTDVRAVQLAKSALRTGIELLCRENRFKRPSRILLAGAFGSQINKTDALRTGMFPDMREEDIEVVGNAAGAGAVLALLNDEYFNKAKKVARQTRVFDLAAHPDFQKTFIEHLSF